jgi:hypothetical protein
MKAILSTFSKRHSSELLDKKESILKDIVVDKTMRKRWEKYSKEYFYADNENVPFFSTFGIMKMNFSDLTSG